eukprot:6108665-Prymnesium_polylepis.1
MGVFLNAPIRLYSASSLYRRSSSRITQPRTHRNTPPGQAPRGRRMSARNARVRMAARTATMAQS